MIDEFTGATGFIGCHVLVKLETKLNEYIELVWHSATKALRLGLQLYQYPEF